MEPMQRTAARKLSVTAVVVTDIRDKQQMYILIGEGEDKVVINVGDKTYNSVKKLTEGPVNKIQMLPDLTENLEAHQTASNIANKMTEKQGTTK